MENNLNYYRRRAAEEHAAADQAPTAAVAAVHRSLAQRYLALAEERQASALRLQVPTTSR